MCALFQTRLFIGVEVRVVLFSLRGGGGEIDQMVLNKAVCSVQRRRHHCVKNDK